MSDALSVGGGSIRNVHPDATVDAAREMFAAGLTVSEVARRMDLSISTVRHWCYDEVRQPGTRRDTCPRCHGTLLDRRQYAYLLGSYLGDGHIVVGRRDVASLSIFCADDYPGIRDEIEVALRSVMPSSSVTRVNRTGCRELKSYAKHWPCLFPQHGPGRKHRRPIVLEPWQLEIVEQHPGALLHGLIHSDGCRITNWTQRRTSSGVKRYEYPRYLFSNKSEDILQICEAALDRVGVDHRRPRWDMVSVARRAAVARLDEFVGSKS